MGARSLSGWLPVTGDGGRHVLGRVTSEVRQDARGGLGPSLRLTWSRPGYYAGMRRHVEAVPDTVERDVRRRLDSRYSGAGVLTPGKSTPLSDEYLARHWR